MLRRLARTSVAWHAERLCVAGASICAADEIGRSQAKAQGGDDNDHDSQPRPLRQVRVNIFRHCVRATRSFAAGPVFRLKVVLPGLLGRQGSG